ncbi:MAG TPA: gliding motility-associated C-terminal domain-containing protein [Bacteroidales bacterium]|nr:gliding motility-associated C-terminal domain-containing protein [Bacteroidales bacterium]
MKKFIVSFLIFFVCFSSATFPQRGKNGPKIISTTGVVVNAYSPLTDDAPAGITSISVASNVMTNASLTQPLGPGDLIFIIQMQGASIQYAEYYEGYGYITNYYNCGKYEFAQVQSVSYNNIITLTCGLSQSYTEYEAQVIRVPRYSFMTINTGGELTCDPWNGTTGGVLVVESMGNVINNGTVNVSGKGFRGGITSPQYANPPLVLYHYASLDVNYGGQKGEGIAENGVVWTGYNCKGAPANGGGGGNSHNSGGGGGSNVSSNLNYNGCGFPDTTTDASYKTAWDLENPPLLTIPGYTVFHKNASYGGGRGGYSFSSTKQNPLVEGPGNYSWGGVGQRRDNIGGFGGWPLIANEGGYPRMYLGGGGGGGHQNDTYGGAGGNGGGIIYVMSYGSISGTGTFVANGNPGGNSEGADPGIASNDVTGIDGAGGGGGGGAVVLNAISTITGVSATANGGKGGDQIKKAGFLNISNEEAEGPGGGGGGGYIAISGGTITRMVSGGQNGTSTIGGAYTEASHWGVEGFPPNGATKGGPGINNAVVTNFSISISPVYACQGQPVTITATLSGTVHPGTTYGWYDAEIGGNQLSNTTSLTLSNPQSSATYYFGTCPGTYRVPYTLTVYPFVPDAGNNVSLCSGNSVQLQASWGGAGGTYSWSPSAGLNNSGVSNPVCSATTTTTYTVTMTNAGNYCTGVDTVRVTVNPIPTIVPVCINHVCNNEVVPATNFVSVPAGSTYTWTNPNTAIGLGAGGTGNIPSFTAVNTGTNPVSVSITVTPTLNNCQGPPLTCIITVNPTPLVTVPANITVCNGTTIPDTGFTSPTTGATYTWTCSNPAIGLAANGTGNIAAFTAVNTGTAPISAVVSVTPTANNCAGIPSTYTITVNPTPAVNVPSDFAVCNGTAVTATAFTSPTSGTTFSWTNSNTSIGLAASGTGNIAGFTAVNTGISPVTSTITVTPSANSCAGTASGYTITVNPTPTVVVPANLTVCHGATVSGTVFSGPTAGTTYTWTNTNTSIGLAVAGTGNIASFTAINTGALPQTATIEVTPAANNCPGIISSYTITVNPIPAVTVPADVALCNNAAFSGTTFSSPTPGTTFTWTNSNTLIGLGSGGTGNLPAFTASNTGTAPISGTITVTPSANGCPGAPSTYLITVNPEPVVTVPANISVCHGATIAMTSFSSPTPGTVFSWTNSNTSIGLAAGGTGNIPAFTASNTGFNPVTATVTVTPSANNCPGVVSTYTITVNPLPVVNVPSGITVCNGNSITGTTFSSPTTGATFTWTNTNTAIGLAGSGSGNIPSFTALNTGTTPISATITVLPEANSCTGIPSDYIITVNPIPTVNVPSNITVCNGTALTGTVFTSPTPGTAYTWTNSNTAIGLAANGTGNIPGFTAVNTGSVPVLAAIVVTPSANSCAGTPSSFTITVNPTDNPAFTYSSSVFCQSGSDPAANITGGAAGVFSASPSGLVFLNSSTGLIDLSASSINTYVITFNTSGLCPASGTDTVSIIVAPSAVFSYAGPYCQDAADPLPVLAPGASAGTFSAIPSGLVFVSSSTGQVDLSASTAGTYTVTNSIAASGGCPAGSATSGITIRPVPVAVVPANVVVCNNGTVPATQFVSNPAGGTFAWTNTNTTIGLGSSGTGDIAAFTAVNTGTGAVSATITLTPVLNGCSGTPSTYTIIVNPTPTVVVPSNLTMCDGATVSGAAFSSPTTGTTYSWTNSNTAVGLGASGTGDIAAFSAVNTGYAPIMSTITVTPTANNCTGAVSAFSITVHPTPTVILPADLSVCSGEPISQTAFTSPTSGATFTWVNSNTAVGLTTSGTDYVPSFTASNNGATAVLATITVTPSANSCTGTPSSYTITVNPLPVIEMNHELPSCPGLNNGTITPVISGGTPPYQYLWSSGENDPQLSSLTNGVYSVTVTDSKSCTRTGTIDFNVVDDCIDPVLYIPNIFSPNGDNHNDVFYIRGQQISEMHLMIYDRWGEKIFETDDATIGWDGTFKGKEMPSDVFVYHVVITMNDGSEIRKKGNLTLVR